LKEKQPSVPEDDEEDGNVELESEAERFVMEERERGVKD